MIKFKLRSFLRRFLLSRRNVSQCFFQEETNSFCSYFTYLATLGSHEFCCFISNSWRHFLLQRAFLAMRSIHARSIPVRQRTSTSFSENASHHLHAVFRDYFSNLSRNFTCSSAFWNGVFKVFFQSMIYSVLSFCNAIKTPETKTRLMKISAFLIFCAGVFELTTASLYTSMIVKKFKGEEYWSSDYLPGQKLNVDLDQVRFELGGCTYAAFCISFIGNS